MLEDFGVDGALREYFFGWFSPLSCTRCHMRLKGGHFTRHLQFGWEWHMRGGVYPITLGSMSTSTWSWIFGGIAWIWVNIVETHVWFNLLTLKVVHANDGLWNMFTDDPTWHSEKNHTSIRLHTRKYLQNVYVVLIAIKCITLHHTLCLKYVL